MQALDRVTSILEVVATTRPAPTAQQVAERINLPLSTTSRLLLQMAERGLLQRRPQDRTYTLGARLLEIVQAGNGAYDFTSTARDLLERLRDATGETVSLHIRRRGERICVQAVESARAVRRVVPVGTSLPLYRTATGEVLLAGAPAVEQQLYIRELALPAREEEELLTRLQQIGAQGWAIVGGGALAGVIGLSAAIQDGGQTVAALSVSGPSQRFTRGRAASHIDLVVAAARTLAGQRGLPIAQ